MTKILYIAATIPVVSLVMALVLLLFGPSEQGVDQGETLQFDRLTKTQPSQSGVRVNMKARDGETIAVQHFASAAPLKLILLHGSGYQGAYLYPLAAHLAKAGEAEVYVPNLRGHHLSGERRGDIDYEDQLTDDITDIIGFIRRDRPLAPLVFAGHSSGGGLAVRYAGSKDGKLAQSYLMLAPFLGHDAPTARKNSGGWAQPALPRIIGLSMLNTFGIKAFNHLPTITFNMPEKVRNGTETLSYSYRLMTGFAPHSNLGGDLSRLPPSSLVLVGEKDEAFLAEAYPPLFRDESNAVVEILPGLSHFDIAIQPKSWSRISSWLGSLK